MSPDRGTESQFDADGVTRLEQIAVLRRSDFSISQIHRMLESPGEIGAVVDEKIGQLAQGIDAQRALLSALPSPGNVSSVEELVAHIRRSESPKAEPIRTSFDEPIPGEADIQAAWREIDAAERRKSLHRKLIPAYIAAALVVLVALFVLFDKFDTYAAKNSDSYPYLQQKLREILEQRDKGVILPDP